MATKVKQLAEWVKESKHFVVFTGADLHSMLHWECLENAVAS